MDQAARVADTRAKKIQSSMRGIGRAVAGAIGFISVGLLVRKIVEATREQEKAIGQLNAVLKSTGSVAGYTSKQLQDMAGAFQKTTTFADEAVLSMEALLLTFTQIRGEEFGLATEAVLNLATALNKDLQTAAIQVGKALNSPVLGISQLARVGIRLSDAQQGAIRSMVALGDVAGAQRVLLAELEVQFGKSAVAARATFGGALTSLGNAFGDLLEGTKGIPELTGQINDVTTALEDPELKEGMATLIAGLATLFSWVVKLAAYTALGVSTVVGFIFGDNSDDVQANQEELNRLLEQRLEILSRLAQQRDRWIPDTKRIAELEAQLVSVELQLNKVNTAALGFARSGADPDFAGGLTPAARPLVPTEEFIKQSDELKKQIALFGKVGKAAEIAYQIQQGGIEGVRDDEAQQLLALAKQLDALEATKGGVNDVNKAAEELKKTYESLTTTLTEQINLAAFKEQYKITAELTELEKARFEIQYGALKALSPEQQARLEQLAGEVDAINAVTAATLKRKDMEEEGKQVTADARTEAEKYADDLVHLKELYEGGFIDEQTLVRQSKKIADAFAEAGHVVNEFMLEASRNVQNILADFLLDPFEDGLEGMVDAFADAMRRMVAEAVAADLARRIFGTGGVGSGGGLIGAAAGWLSGFFGAGGGATATVTSTGSGSGTFRGLYAQGGYIPEGGYGLAGERGPELVYAGRGGLSVFSNADSMAVMRELMSHAPSRDTGGRGRQGQVYQIGTGAQPEWFIPDSPGTFALEDSLGGDAGITNNFMIAAPTGSVSRQTQMQIAAAAARGVTEAQRRNN
jgi:hypothetical protein